MNERKHELPFKNLGERLKTIRQKLQESRAEVSGAVEIDEQQLARIEKGLERPSEDVLMLLFSHFGLKDDEAAGLWELAGYDQADARESEESEGPPNARAVSVVMVVDPRVIYSDGVEVNAGPNGVMISFAQGAGTPQHLVTARVGMSRKQAYNLLNALQQVLVRTEPRQLPPGSKNSEAQKSQD